MKTILQKLMCMAFAAMACMSVNAQATSGSCGDNATWEYDNGTLTIAGTGEITTYSTENPTAYPWFAQLENIQTVIIGEGITNIPAWAFGMYENLASVSLPSTLRSIGNSALEECAFTSITLPEGLESIGYMAFLMAKFTELTIPSTVTNIDGNAFNYSDLVTVTSLATTPPSQTVGAGDGLFENCSSLNAINVPAASVDAYKAASGWSNYAALIVAGGSAPATTTFTYTASEKVTSFDTYANFTGATGVSSHEFADGAGTVVYEGTVTAIADGMMGTSYYSQNTSLTGVVIPSGVETIGMGAFSYCSNLASVTLPDDLITLDQGSFAYTKIASVTIPDQVENINAAAFMGCTQLTSIDIPNSVTFLGNNIFLGCSKLASVTLGSGIIAISRKLFDNCVMLESIVIPDGVTIIGAEAFMGCTGLKTVTIGSGVTEIEDGSTNGYDEAFRDCSSVTDVYCYASPTTLTWAKNSNTTIFKSSKATLFHVADADAWNTKFPSANVTFVGDLNAFALADNADNTAAIAVRNGKVCDVTLTGRTLQTGSYNTFAVPFDISAAELLAKGITAKKLTASSFADGVLSQTFADAATIEAGKPYLVKVSANVVNPVFEGVTISNTTTNTETTAVDFIPTMGKTEVTGDAESTLFLGAANTLYYPTSLPADMKGFRAYFVVKGEAALAPARGFSMDFGDGETTGIISLKAEGTTNGEKGIYTLDGRKLQGQSTQKGVYIVNGKKVIK